MFPLLTALLLFASQYVSNAQEADVEEGNHMSVTISPRLEGNIGHYESDYRGYTHRSLANSMLYMTLDGNFTDNLSLYGAIQLLGTDPLALYGKDVLFNPQYTNFLNMLLLTYSLGPVDISFGKDALAFGGFEQEPDLIDTYWDALSNSWHLIQSYLWGGRITLNIGDQAPFIQIVDSPIKERIFGKGGFCYFGGWDGQFFDEWQTKWSFGAMQTPEDGTMKILSLGNRWSYDDLAFTLDYTARSFGLKTLFKEEMSLVGDIRYSFKKIDFFSKFGWEFYHGEDVAGYFSDFESDSWNVINGGSSDKMPLAPTIVPNMLGLDRGLFRNGDYLFASLGAEWYPLDNRDLRVHLVGAMNNYNKSVSLTAGITYDLNFNLW